MKNITRIVTASAAVTLSLTFLAPGRVLAHCDSLDGPVVKAAERALETRNVAQVLMWVQVDDEPEIRAAFEQTLIVRASSPQARALADRYFFETVVRLHRAGEGASYTGLQPAGRDLGPAIPAADKAIETGSLSPLAALLAKGLDDGLRRHFEKVTTAKRFDTSDVMAGRQYAGSYVEFIHYVERLYEAIVLPAHGHVAESAAVPVMGAPPIVKGDRLIQKAPAVH